MANLFTGGLSSLAKSIFSKVGERKAEVAIFELDENDDLARGTDGLISGLRFQYFPASISDSKNVNYQTREIPGGSLPLYQWISSGEREISFDTIFSNDIDLLADGSASAPILVGRVKAAGEESRNIDIRSAIAWLRRFLLPTYNKGSTGSTGVPLTLPPRKLMLVIPNSGIGLAGGDAGSRESLAPHSIICFMNTCSILTEAVWPSGMPRLVKVSLSFHQLAQRSGNVIFPSVTSAMSGAVSGSPFLGYRLKARTQAG